MAQILYCVLPGLHGQLISVMYLRRVRVTWNRLTEAKY